VTDARQLWDTWRDILRGADPIAGYESTPAATEINIGMFRRGLVRNALTSLHLVPLTRRLLLSAGVDEREVAADFTQSTGFRDDGPYLWRTAAGFVAYLAALPEFARPSWQDVLAIDRASIALVRRLGETPPAIWPDDAARALRAARESGRLVASRAAVVASSNFDLTSWLENPLTFDAHEDLERSAKHWLIYVPNAEAAHTYAELSERAARVFSLLPKVAEDAIEVIDSLAEIGVVTGEGEA